MRQIVRDALAAVDPGARVLAVIPDQTRDDNTDLLFPMLSQELAARGAEPVSTRSSRRARTRR